MTLTFAGVGPALRAHEQEIRARIDAVMAHGRFILGPEVFELEEALAAQTGVRHVVSCSDGTTALVMALMAYGVGRGDAVLTPTFSFVAAAEAVALVGATPVFVDVRATDFNVDPDLLDDGVERATQMGLRPRGIVAVDLFGVPADFNRIVPWATAKNLFVIEDGAQAMGAMRAGRAACSFGDVATTSFFPTKPLGCLGDGGALFTDDDGLAQTLRSIRMHGQGEGTYDHCRLGLNGRLDTLQAAVLLAKLPHLADALEARAQVARAYGAGLGGVAGSPASVEGVRSAWAQYCILVDGRDGLRERLATRGIPTAVYYPAPLHRQRAFADVPAAGAEFPVAMDLCARVLALPIHPYMSAEDVDRVIGAVASA